jgi:hypothetical protein
LIKLVQGLNWSDFNLDRSLIAGHNLESALDRVLKPPKQDLSDPAVQKKREIEVAAKLVWIGSGVDCCRQKKTNCQLLEIASRRLIRVERPFLIYIILVLSPSNSIHYDSNYKRFVVVGQQQPKKYLGSFKAGIMNWNAKTKVIAPDQRKGELYLFLVIFKPEAHKLRNKTECCKLCGLMYRKI